MTLSNLGTPAAEFVLDEAFVAALLAEQHPDLAQLELRHVDAGWDNYMFRLGDELAVRLPRRALAAELIVKEQRWLPDFAPALTLPIPVPLRTGRPARGYPWCWSVVPWLAGLPADVSAPAAHQAPPFAAFLRSLHRPAPAAAPQNPYRGGPLAARAQAVAERLARLETRSALITPALRRVWSEALAAEPAGEPVWLHGDLHPGNVLVRDGAVSGVIDWGDLAAGDGATDLAAIWMLFEDPHARRSALRAYGEVAEPTLRRARGWAVNFGSLLLESGLVDHPRHAAIGERTLRRLAEAP